MDSKLIFVLALCGNLFISSAFGQLDLQTPTLSGFPFHVPQPQKNGFNFSETSPTNNVTNDLSQPWRLSRDIIPHLYKLTIVPILDADQPVGEQWTVPGSVAIEVTANATTRNVTIHRSEDLTINSINITTETGVVIPITSFDKYNAQYQFLHIELEEDLVEGQNYTMTFEFVSQIHTELHGLYKSQYLDPTSNQLKWIGVSQMEAINARELFPCFDEPYFKAYFDVTIGKREDQTVLCNSKSLGIKLMPGASGWQVEEFERTPRMSTYLFATVISDFEFAKSSGDILPQTEVRTYAPKHYIDQGRGNYSAEMGAIMLKHFADYFKQEYPMNKMDLAGVPAFYFGAMENFGLNIYREALLLYFDQEDTENERLQITEVLSHELAHQWHGNRVSPAWWTHIWLNEGFADFLQYLGMEASAPEFKPWDKITLTSQKVALQVDADISMSHPLKIEEDKWIMKDPMDWFDQITYQKGGSLIYMMQGFLTREVLQEGLQNYHERMQFQAAEQDFLFEDLTTVARKYNKIPAEITMKDIMDTWTLQSGFPLLKISLNSSETGVSIDQTKYMDESSPSQWIVPISLATETNPNFDFEPELWLQTPTHSIELQLNEWIIANAGGSGYYRVMYDEKLEQRISAILSSSHDTIDYRSRSQLIDDYFTFAYEKMKTIEAALEFTAYLKAGETEYIVWSVVLQHLKTSMNLFESAGYINDLKEYVVPRIVAAVEATGGVGAISTETKGQDVLRHTLLLDWLCAMGDMSCLSYSAGLVESWRAGGSISSNPVPKDLRPVVYCASVASSPSSFDFIHDLYLSGNDAEGITTKQKSILLKSLSCAQDDSLINTLLEGTMRDGFYNSKAEAIQVLEFLASNKNARQLTLRFFEASYNGLVSYFGSNDPIIKALAAMSRFVSAETELNELDSFVSNHGELSPYWDAYRRLVQNNIGWMDDFGKPMQEFFRSQNQIPSTTTTEDPENPEPTTTTEDPENPEPTTTTEDPENPEPTTTTEDPENPEPTTTTEDPGNPEPTTTTEDPENPKPTTTTKDPENPEPTTTTGDPTSSSSTDDPSTPGTSKGSFLASNFFNFGLLSLVIYFST